MNPKTTGILVGFAIILIVGGIVFFQVRQNKSTDIISGTGGQATGTPQTLPVYTFAQVALHASISDCWSAINGKVYDLTKWIPQHPGGQEAILSICGKDGSAAFNAQHGGASLQQRILATFLTGTLSK